MCHDTIHRLEEKIQSADRAVELLERKLKERKESMEQMATREHNYQLALESLQKQFAEKEDQLQSVKNELNHLESQRIGSQKLISENKDLQKRLKAKHGQLKQLCQQFLQYQKERISVISQALATHYEHKRHDQKADTWMSHKSQFRWTIQYISFMVSERVRKTEQLTIILIMIIRNIWILTFFIKYIYFLSNF